MRENFDNVIEIIDEKKKILGNSRKSGFLRILAAIGILSLIVAVAFGIYKRFNKDEYIEDFDDDFDNLNFNDDFDNDFFDEINEDSDGDAE